MGMTRPAALLLALAATAAGCSTLFHEGESPPPARFAAIDETRGSYGGVAIGDGRRRVFDFFGRRQPVGEDESALPEGAPEDGVAGPPSIPITGAYCYVDVCFWFEEPGRGIGDEGAPGIGPIEGFEITSPGARTLRGIQVGDDLDDAERAYPRLRCDDFKPGESWIEVSYCYGSVGRDRYIWFGGDPIEVIAVSGFPLA
jgi:hypothetical protein